MSKVFFLADDDLDDQDMFIEAVQSMDAANRVVSAFDGEEAMRFLHGALPATPDFIFLDLNMPKLNGKQCLARIREMKELENVPVYVYTTSLQRDVSEYLQLGARRFLTKPSTYPALQAMLADVLTGQGG